MVQKHFTDKESAKIKAEKAQEQNLRKIAGTIGKEVRNFWGNVEKLFHYSVRTQIDQKRKQALDQHLNFIVDKTEKIVMKKFSEKKRAQILAMFLQD